MWAGGDQGEAGEGGKWAICFTIISRDSAVGTGFNEYEDMLRACPFEQHNFFFKHFFIK